ncbi:MAG: calcineurin-like phosphoesterase C-terminal domain-containing protein [Gammaproteobacteria bacterium]
MRTLLKRRLFYPLLAVAGLPTLAWAQCDPDRPGVEFATGSVFVDSNGDGRRNGSESGLSGVAVSNGCNVVLSDGQGNYRIDIAANEILFISKPAGYSVPVDEFQVPRFFYRHYPDGTPEEIAGTAVEWLFPVIEATGPLPTTIDFPLIPDNSEQASFLAHGFADTQARYDLGQDMLREDLVNPLIGNPYQVEFGLTVGDVVYDNLALYERHKRMMSLMAIPQWNLPGNHDLNFNSPNAYFANESYKRHYGPTYYSFNQGNVHFVALNNVEYAGAGQEFADGRYRGYITDNQLRWLENDLAHVATDKLIVIATHIPLITEATDSNGTTATGPSTENFSRLLDILAPFQNIYGLAGHDTSNSWKVEIDHQHGWSGQPWLAHTLAEVRGNGWDSGPKDLRGVRDAMMQDGNPNGFYLLHFDDTRLTPEFIPFPFGADAAQRLRITLDPPLAEEPQGSINRGVLHRDTKLVVNLFDGGVRDSVWYSLDGGPRLSMQYTVRTDPFAEKAYQRFLDTDSAFSSPTLSSHIWEAELGNELSTGLHSIVVTSEDEFGQRQRGNFTFEILP